MEKFSRAQLEALVTRLAKRIGVPEEDAKIFARALVDADLHGVSTHGVSRLNIYFQRIQAGLIVPDAELKFERRRGCAMSVDAGNGIGHVQAAKTLEALMPIARESGVAAAAIRNSQHFGVLSYYCNLAADQGFVLLAMTNAEPAMAPAGGYQPFFGTNPIAASFPTGKGYNVRIDLATSTVARGKIIAARKQGLPIPSGWALDRNGEPTTDAAEALMGTVLTMAGHRGYALALLVEIFSSLLSGAATGDEVGSMYKDMDRRQNVGHFFCLFDIEAFLDSAKFLRRMDAAIDRIKAGRKRPGTEEILIPGERFARAARQREREGITLTPETEAELRQWCSRLGVDFEAALASQGNSEKQVHSAGAGPRS